MIRILVITDKTKQEVIDRIDNMRTSGRVTEPKFHHHIPELSMVVEYYCPAEEGPAIDLFGGAQFDSIVYEGSPDISTDNLKYLCTRLRSSDNKSVMSDIRDIWIKYGRNTDESSYYSWHLSIREKHIR